MAKYDASGDRVKSRFPIVSLSLIIVGIVVLVIGIIVYNNTDMSKYGAEKTNINETYDGSQITDINIDFAFGEILVDKSSDGNIHVEGTNIPEYYKITAEGNTFSIKTEKDTVNFWDCISLSSEGWNFWDSNNLTVKVYLPDKKYDIVKIDSGAGHTKLNNISCSYAEFDLGAGDCDVNSLGCDDASIDLGAGDCDIIGITAARTLKIENGAGNITVQNGDVGGVDIDSGAGDFDFSGSINGDIDADVGAGNCTFTLSNPESDYRFKGDGERRYGSSDGRYTVDIDSGAGDITFTFGESDGINRG